jgi:hypothetical protein
VSSFYLKPKLYESIATDKQMLCSKNCAPTVAFKSADGKLEDKVYSLSFYNTVEIGKAYLLEDNTLRTVFRDVGVVLLLLCIVTIGIINPYLISYRELRYVEEQITIDKLKGI